MTLSSQLGLFFLSISFLLSSLANFCCSSKVLSDDEVPVGKKLRGVDYKLSQKFGGYRTIRDGSRSEPTIYGRWVEPVLHACEHTRRAIMDRGNWMEWARARDELRTLGCGLHTMGTRALFHSLPPPPPPPLAL